jgi:ribosomal protein S11
MKEEIKGKEEKAEEKIEQKAEIIEEKKEEIEESKIETVSESKHEKEEIAGIVYIFSSQNNTIVHITDMAGNTISRISGGMVTKHDRLKSDPTIAMFVAKRAAERAKDLGLTSLYIRMRAKTGSIGIGPGAHAVVRSLGKEGFKIISILDTTRVPRGGPKKKGGKRGRRV